MQPCDGCGPTGGNQDGAMFMLRFPFAGGGETPAQTIAILEIDNWLYWKCVFLICLTEGNADLVLKRICVASWCQASHLIRSWFTITCVENGYIWFQNRRKANAVTSVREAYVVSWCQASHLINYWFKLLHFVLQTGGNAAIFSQIAFRGPHPILRVRLWRRV